jgi:hypothetical protein
MNESEDKIRDERLNEEIHVPKEDPTVVTD